MFIKKYKNNIITVSIMLLFVALLSSISFCKLCNKMNYLSTDVAVWVNVVKKMQLGDVIYKDIFDHKGPILYFLYYFFYRIKGNVGLWILDIICSLCDVLAIYLISMKMKIGKKKAILVVGFSFFFLALTCEEHPCAESICLPLILIALYNFIKFLKNKDEFKNFDALINRYNVCYGYIDKK